MLTRNERKILGAAVSCALAISAYRVLDGNNIWPWALNLFSIIPLVVPWALKRLMEYGDSLPPATSKFFEGTTLPFWWRYMEAYLVVAAIVWVGLLLATSIPSIPHKVGVFILIFDCAGPVLMVGITNLIMHFASLGFVKSA